jgi:hypothetical protein
MKNPNADFGRSLPALVSRSALAVFPILFALAALSFLGCMTDSDKGPNRTLTSGEYVNHDIGLKLSFPAAWEAKLDQPFGETKIDLIILDAPRNGFRPNLTVMQSPHSGPTLMSEVLPLLRSDIQARFPDFSNYQESVASITGKEAGRIDYETSFSGPLLHFRMLLFVNNGRDVVITLSDRAEDFAVNPEVQGMFDGITITSK